MSSESGTGKVPDKDWDYLKRLQSEPWNPSYIPGTSGEGGQSLTPKVDYSGGIAQGQSPIDSVSSAMTKGQGQNNNMENSGVTRLVQILTGNFGQGVLPNDNMPKSQPGLLHNLLGLNNV